MRYLCLFSLIISLFVFGCTNHDLQHNLNQLSWLEGTWQGQTDGQLTVETWVREKNNHYRVAGYLLEGNDTIFSESIAVKPVKGEIMYLVTLAGQKKNKPVPFRLLRCSDTEAIFSNPEHDFPRQIAYLKQNENTILIKLSGQIREKPVSQAYTLTKTAGGTLPK